MPDDLTAILDHVRDGAESEIVHPDDECGIRLGGFCVPHAAVRLLAAVEAALKVHQPVDRGTGAQCKGCATHVTFTQWPCPTVRAITAALTEGEDGNG
jgi:hypothetical protein